MENKPIESEPPGGAFARSVQFGKFAGGEMIRSLFCNSFMPLISILDIFSPIFPRHYTTGGE